MGNFKYTPLQNIQEIDEITENDEHSQTLVYKSKIEFYPNNNELNIEPLKEKYGTINGFSDSFPSKLVNILDPLEFKSSIDHINEPYKNSMKLGTIFFIYISCFIILVGISFVLPFFKVGYIAIGIYSGFVLFFTILVFIYLIKRSRRIKNKVYNNIIDLNKNMLSRGISFNLLELISFKEHCKITDSRTGFYKINYDEFKQIPSEKLIISFSKTQQQSQSNYQKSQIMLESKNKNDLFFIYPIDKSEIIKNDDEADLNLINIFNI